MVPFLFYETFQLLTYKIGKILRLNYKTDQKVVIKEIESCVSCKKCEKVCPVQLALYKDFDEEGIFQDEACIRCSTCIENCPLKLLEKDIA